MLFPANETTRQGVSLTTTGAKYFHTRYQIIIVKSNSLPSISENLSHEIKKGGGKHIHPRSLKMLLRLVKPRQVYRHWTDEWLGSISKGFSPLALEESRNGALSGRRCMTHKKTPPSG